MWLIAKYLQFDAEGEVVESKVDELIESMIESTEAQAEIKEKAAACAQNTTEVLTGIRDGYNYSSDWPFQMA